MKKILLLILAIPFLLTACKNATPTAKLTTINPILGDVSFVQKFGTAPTSTTDDQLRIKTHFEYVEQLLRQKDVSDWSQSRQQKRAHTLNLLHDYATAGLFPKNYDYKDERKPCFIDRDGTICAVGYLVEQTAGRQLAEAINTNFQYATVEEINTVQLDDWVASSGLTNKECAMIQPTYGSYYENPNYISMEYGVASAVLSGVNIPLTMLNGIQVAHPGNSKTIPKLGMLTGMSQVVVGVGGLPIGNGVYPANESKKTVAFMNIGLGTSTFLMSGYNLLANSPKRKEKSTSWNIYSYPADNSQIAFGFAFSKRF